MSADLRPAARVRLGLAALLLLAFALRVAALGSQELRGDEAFGYFFSQQPYAAVIDQTLALDEPHPVASYFVLKAWQQAAGASEYALRFVSVWFGVVAVGLLARVARRLALPARVALAALALAAVSPYAVWHAQDARMYAMSLALNTATVWLAMEALARRRWQWVAGYIGAAWLALHTHYFSFFILAALTLFVLGRALVAPSARRAVADWLMWNVILAVAYLPWLTSAGTILAGYGGNGDSPAFAAMASRALAVFAVGESTPTAQRPLWAALLAAICLLGAVRLWLAGAGGRRALWLLACWGLVPVLLTWYGALDRPIFNERYLIAAAPAYWLLAACALLPLSRPRRWFDALGPLLLALLLAGMFASLARHYIDPAFSKTRGWRALAAQMRAAGGGLPADAVVYAQNYPDPTLWYTAGPLPHLVLPPAAQDAAGARREVAALDARVQRVVLAAQDAPTWDAGRVSAQALDAAFDRAAVIAQPPWEVEIWSRTPLTLPARSETFAADGGARIRLTRAQIEGTPAAGGVLTAHLAWAADGAPPPDTAVSVQLLGADGALLAQQDTPLTPALESGRAAYGILLPSALPPGALRLIVALYDPAAPGAPRLRTQAAGDAVELAAWP